MIISKKIDVVKIKNARPFHCNGQHCHKKLGEIDPVTGYLYQQSKRWHFSNVIIDGWIQCQCGWRVHYEAKNFKMEGE